MRMAQRCHASLLKFELIKSEFPANTGNYGLRERSIKCGCCARVKQPWSSVTPGPCAGPHTLANVPLGGGQMGSAFVTSRVFYSVGKLDIRSTA